jgi:hypothetical protein
MKHEHPNIDTSGAAHMKDVTMIILLCTLAAVEEAFLPPLLVLTQSVNNFPSIVLNATLCTYHKMRMVLMSTFTAQV